MVCKTYKEKCNLGNRKFACFNRLEFCMMEYDFFCENVLQCNFFSAPLRTLDCPIIPTRLRPAIHIYVDMSCSVPHLIPTFMVNSMDGGISGRILYLDSSSICIRQQQLHPIIFHPANLTFIVLGGVLGKWAGFCSQSTNIDGVRRNQKG